MNRESELAEIERFIRERGITIVPSEGSREIVELNEKRPLAYDFKKRQMTRNPVPKREWVRGRFKGDLSEGSYR